MAICSSCKEETFHYRVVDGKDMCLRCHRVHVMHGSIFPFTTEHIAGPDHPITINSLYHLRQVERAYGVQMAAFHMDEKNMSAERFSEEVPARREFTRVNFGRWDPRGG